MKIERTKNAARNIFFGTILKVYQILVPFLMRTAMIYLMGIQYLGLNSLFTSVLQVLSLAELGVGTAMMFSMYKPVAESDANRICALLKLYKIYYRIIGIVIGAVGVTLTPFIPKLINGDTPADINIYILYLLNLGATVLSYWLFAYKNSLLQAHQRADVVSKITIITSTIQYILQLIVLWIFHNYYLYVIIALLSQAITNIVTAIVASKMYPNYQPKGDLEPEEKKKINQKIKDLFTAQLGYVVNTSVDTVVISAFLGLVPLAVYNNYYFIMNSILGFITIIFNSVTAGIGNSLIMETKEKNFNDLKKITFIIFWLATFCCCCFLNLYQPFMELWVGKELMLSYGHVVVMSSLFFVQSVRKVWIVMKDAAGIWQQDRFRPLITAGCNLALNIISVRYFGLYGIMLSTIIAELFISFPWLWKNLFTYVLPVDNKKYFRNVVTYVLVCVLCCVVSILTCRLFDLSNILTLLVNGAVCLIISNAIQIVLYRKTKEFNDSFALVKKMISKRERV